MSTMAIAFQKMLGSGINGGSEKLRILLDVLYDTGDTDLMSIERIFESMSFRWEDLVRHEQGEAGSYYAAGCLVKGMSLRRSLIRGLLFKFNADYKYAG